MDGLELGLSRGFRLSAMASYGMVINRYGVWGRTAAAMIMLLIAGLFAAPSWRAVQLLPLTAGVALAWVDVHPAVAETQVRRGVMRRWLAAHPADLDTATANLAGLLEGFGVVAAGLLFAGPIPASVSRGPRTVALIVVTVYAWNAFSQVTADPGYYNMNPPPARWAVGVKWLLPAATAVVAFVIFRGFGATGAVPVPWWLATLLAGSFLLIWAYAGTLNLLLRCATSAANDEVISNLGAQERIHYEYVHRAKNELRPDFRQVSPDTAEYLAYATAVVIVDNAIRDIEAAWDNEDDAHSIDELWRRYRRTVSGSNVRGRLQLVDMTASRKLSHMEGLILQSIFVGLVSNALRASPDGPVVVTVSDDMNDKDSPTVRVMVEDEGVGGAPSTFEVGTGLAHLQDLCSRYKGGVWVTERHRGGTRAIAAFNYPRLINAVGTMNNYLQKGTSDG